MVKIVILDSISQDGLDILASTPGIEYEIHTGLKGEELRETLMNFDGAICRSGVKLTKEILEGNTRLKAIARAGVGVDNIDKITATRQGILVMNTPDGNTLSTAELAITLMLALSRQIYPAYDSLVHGRWDRKAFMGTQLAGKTLGLIGLGRIGRAVAERAQALGMKIVAFDPFMSEAKAAELEIRLFSNYREMLPFCDYLSVHTPLTEETRGMISTNEIQSLPKGARLINCARGGIYDEAALVEGLKSGHLGGVALDVYPNEPCTDSPLFGMPNVLCTPHLGASTHEAQKNVALEAVKLLVDYFTTGTISSAVNMSPLDGKVLSEMRGSLALAWRLGLLASQMVKNQVSRCQINFLGKIATKSTTLLTGAFAAGLLSQASDGESNIINAKMLLQERGIDLTVQQSETLQLFDFLITVKIYSGEKETLLTGALFGNTMPRLIQVNEHRLEAFLDGNLCLLTHHDQPGVIGQMGTIFGKHHVNIGQMSTGRSSGEGKAISILSLDTKPSAAAVEELKAFTNIQSLIFAELPAENELPSWLQ
ncbi:MAG: phosphoglycerate dehydrogenase [Planctomycetia bacterium]|nr:phosphoglycerate dehydrogenase [Planctomycetia bacterium]